MKKILPSKNCKPYFNFEECQDHPLSKLFSKLVGREIHIAQNEAMNFLLVQAKKNQTKLNKQNKQ